MGKTPEQILEIVRSMSTKNSNILVTKTNTTVYELIKKVFPAAEFHSASGVLTIRNKKGYTGKGKVLVISAGTVVLLPGGSCNYRGYFWKPKRGHCMMLESLACTAFLLSLR